jgi:hypothetical protein
MRSRVAIILSAVLAIGACSPGFSQRRDDTSSVAGQYLTFGIFIGSIEEGARIFTPTRFLPFEHPEALGHQLPTVLQFHGGEDRLLVELGRQAGLLLGSTIQRYPVEPDTSWPYAPFRRPPVAEFMSIPARRKASHTSPLPGLRAVAYLDRFPLAFIIDTRGMSLAERHMDRATSSGLDVTRAQIINALKSAAQDGPLNGPWMLIYERP